MNDREYTIEVMKRVRRLLKLKKMTSKELASRMGICNATVCYFNTGRRIMTAYRLREIANVLGVSIEELAPGNSQELDKRSKIYATICYYNPEEQQVSEHSVELIAKVLKDPEQMLFPANPEESRAPAEEPAV